DILAATLPQWDVTGFPIAGENLTLLKVDVDRVIPATATVLQCPDLARPVFRRCRDATEVRSEHGAAIGLHAPGAKGTRNGVIGGLAGATPEFEDPLPRHGNFRQIGVRDQGVRHLALVRAGGIPNDPELQEFPDAGIGRLASQGLSE